MQAYCVKCKAKREMKDPRKETVQSRSGQRTMMKGTCSDCGTKMNKFVKGE